MIDLVFQNPKLVMLFMLIGTIVALSHFNGGTVPHKRLDL
jgi:hypothetical protein